MPTNKEVTKSKSSRKGPAQTGPTAAAVAKARRAGATWQQVRKQFGVKTRSGAFAKLLASGGFDRAGLRLDGKGARSSKARVLKREEG